MKKVLFFIITIAFISCQKYERVNPLDPYFNAGSDSENKIELLYKSYRLVQKPDEPSNYVFDFYITIENTGNKSVGSAINPVSGKISTSDQNITIAFGDTKEFGSSSSGYEIVPKQTKENGFSYMLRVAKTISTNYQSTINLTITDSESGKSWNEQFDITINL
jgi:hypothetical protein